MPLKKEFDPETEEKIVRLYQEKGMRTTEISRLLGTSVLPVNRVLRDREIPVNTPGSPQKTTRNQKIMDLHDEGHSLQEIATAFGVSRQRVHQVVTRGY